MSIMKDLFIDAYDELVADAEEAGVTITKEVEDKICEKADALSRDRFADMCDMAWQTAKDRGLV